VIYLYLFRTSGISIGGPKKSQVNLKKLNWRKMMLNQQSVNRAGGAIWKELPSVDLPKDTFTHLFTQHTVVKEKATEKAVSSMYNIIWKTWSVDL
jgi:hypothetical protein